MYWAKELANQTTDTELQSAFGDIASQLEAKEIAIVEELNNAQGKVENIEGYYLPNESATFAIMRPSTTLNTIIDNL